MKYKEYSNIKALKFMLMVYPNSRKSILDEVNKSFSIYDISKGLMGDFWFAIAKNGECAFFNENGKEVPASQFEAIDEDMTRVLHTLDCQISNVIIPIGIKRIGERAFSSQALTSIKIPSTVNEIGHGAFIYSSSLKEVNIPDGVDTIPSGCFYRCKSLESIEIPKSVTTIKSMAFEDCKSLKSIDIPSYVNIIESNVFSGCESLEEIVFPEGVHIIPAFAFSRCTNLRRIVFMGHIDKINQHAFGFCDNPSTWVKVEELVFKKNTIEELHNMTKNDKDWNTIIQPSIDNIDDDNVPNTILRCEG